MNKRIFKIFIAIAFFTLLLILNMKAFKFDKTIQKNTPSAIKITDVKANVNGISQNISLPKSFKKLKPSTPITIFAQLNQKKGDCIYIKSVYSPIKVYIDNKLIYEYGQQNKYPNFMLDPATSVKIIQLSNYNKVIDLKIEYLSPTARDVLTIHPVLIGSETSIMKSLFNSMGFSFIFSIIQIFLGAILIIISLFVVSFERKGIAFFWLGLFVIATGSWAFGECNLTGLFIHNPTILYIAAFVGLFTMPIPLIYFGLTVVNFHNQKPLRICAFSLIGACSIALILQFLRLIPFSKSMYIFHILVPLALCFFAFNILYEGIKYNNKSARRFFFPIIVLALSAILEVINYQFRFTNVLSSFFQIGIIIFIFLTSMIGSIFVRNALELKVQKQRLEYEVSLMEKQVKAQKKHHELLLQNAEMVKIQRHDLRHQLAVIRNYSENEDKSRLLKYLDNLIKEIPSENDLAYCENIAVNAIVSYYASLAKSKGIELTIKLNIKENSMKISDSNLCVIIGNLFENAIEACEHMLDGHKFICLCSRLQYEILTITMDNSFDGKILQKDKEFVSRKSGDIGTGLNSVKAVAQKYDGAANFKTDGFIFLSSVYVKVN